MNYTMDEAARFIEENDVKFIRLAFCDIFGIQKNISIMPAQLLRAFEEGVSFDACAVRGFLHVEESDLFLVPDPATLSVLPWRPSHGRVVRFFCDIRRQDGTPFEGDARHILREAQSRLRRRGYACRIGPECEFYLLRTDENGDPTMTPHDNAGYCDIAPLDRGEDVRREICLTLEEMGIIPESSHHEQGPGQNEIDFRYDEALSAADQLVTFKAVVKAIAARNGLYATFLPKPFPDQSGSGLHVNLSLAKGTHNLFLTGCEPLHSQEAESFTQGILRRTAEITSFLNPLPSSYERFACFEAPRYVTWGRGNRSQLVRVPAARGELQRIELRSPDPACNPYLAFALLMEAGMEGVDDALPLETPAGLNLCTAPAEQTSHLQRLPSSLTEAIRLTRESDFVRRVLPAALVDKYLSYKEAECRAAPRTTDAGVLSCGMDLRY